MLPKKARLSKEVKRVLEKQELRINTPLFTLVARKNFLGLNRVAVVCSKKVGNAVKRNRIRRKIAMSYQNTFNIGEKYDMVFIARPNEAEIKKYREQIVRIFEKLSK
ncbi:MAG: ribonuclease P protein component [Candidatus Margulisbacteria bacterium]|nr:ribonuclease P protein component [Candidatus Margulisiibacteriota bacterium]MBU1616695.1 ribonuclease P protein component [Candidatus Margulisiibacteriota bacterium]